MTHQNSETPDVAGSVVALLLQNLWRDVHGGVAGRRQKPVLGPELFGEAEVADPNGVRVSWAIKENSSQSRFMDLILGLEVVDK